MTRWIVPLFIIALGCSSRNDSSSVTGQEKPTMIPWELGAIDPQLLVNGKDSFHMYDAVGNKVGSMVWDVSRTSDTLALFDISQFDDGSAANPCSL